MKVLIVGATGLIGLYLVDDLLKAGHEVIATGRNFKNKEYFTKRGVSFLQLDITNIDDFDRLPQEGVDVVVHLAAIMPATMSGYDPKKYIDINVVGTMNVLEYCKKTKVKQILYTESHSDVGGHWGKKTIDPYENYSIRYGDDHTVYIVSKIAALELIKHYHSECGLAYAVFRCPNIYAHHPSKFFFVNGKKREVAYRKLITKAINSEPIEIWGDCKTAKDIVYVKDLTQMMVSSIDKTIQSSIYNVSTGVATSLEDQIKGIISVFSPNRNPSKIIYRPDIKVHLNNHHYSIKNAEMELEYKPKYYYISMLEDIKREMEGDRFLNFEL